MGRTVFRKLVGRNRGIKMSEIIGIWILFIAISFLVTFLVGDDLSFVDKIKIVLGMTVFVTFVLVGSYLATGGV